MMPGLRVLFIWGVLLPGIATAVVEPYRFEQAAMEADYRRLIHELRCLVCQNQNLADSDADLAKDLRQQIYNMLVQGNDSEQVIQYMVDRYGDFVLYRPQLQRNTLLLWFGPFLLLALAVWQVTRNFAGKQLLVEPDDTAMARAKALLSEREER